MKDYSMNKKEKETYIKKVKKLKKGNTDCLEIEFADGRKFKNITYSPENIEKITQLQEEQAKTGIARKKTFERQQLTDKTRVMTGLILGSLLTAAGTQATGHGAIPFAALSFICTGAYLTSYVSITGKVKELEKLEYRNKNKADLDALRQYRNALTGLSKSKRNYIKKTKEPFSILNINNFSKKDLEKIISNIEREKTYDFDYLPKTKIKEK